MDKNAYLSDKEAKMDPTPSDTVKALPVCELIRKMRWTILGLEYHVSRGIRKGKDRPSSIGQSEAD